MKMYLLWTKLLFPLSWITFHSKIWKYKQVHEAITCKIVTNLSHESTLLNTEQQNCDSQHNFVTMLLLVFIILCSAVYCIAYFVTVADCITCKCVCSLIKYNVTPCFTLTNSKVSLMNEVSKQSVLVTTCRTRDPINCQENTAGVHRYDNKISNTTFWPPLCIH